MYDFESEVCSVCDKYIFGRCTFEGDCSLPFLHDPCVGCMKSDCVDCRFSCPDMFDYYNDHLNNMDWGELPFA